MCIRDRYTDFYLHDGESEANAHQLAVKDAMERNALYVAAIQNGFSVTDEEIQEWLTKLRTMLENDTTGVSVSYTHLTLPTKRIV